MQATVPEPGSVIASRFRVESELGRGGMGVVLRGRDETNRPVAIKVLLPEAIEHPEAVPRFVNEARAARELTSEHSVRVFDAGTLDTGLPFMVMELLEGEDLATQLEKRGRFTVPDACDAIIDACDALAEAHARGMVHRDLKPANLFAARDPSGRVRVKVLDFGVSKVAAQIRQMALTSTGTALGTPYYMAPEQLKSAKGVDARADIWSLGVVLYELLSGRVPFDGESFGMLFMQIVSQEPKPLSELQPDVPPGIVEIVDRCLKKKREDRYTDLTALIGSLARFASPSGQAAARRIVEGPGSPAPAARDSVPMIPMALKGTVLMANAPQALQQVRQAQAASQVPQMPAPAAGPAPNHHDSARYSVPGYSPQTPPHAIAPPGTYPPAAPPSAVPAPPPKKAPSTFVWIGILAVFLVILAVGVLFILSARGH